MPFRIPSNYTSLSCVGSDPARVIIESYIRWLKAELEVAQAALDALIVHAPAKPQTPKE